MPAINDEQLLLYNKQGLIPGPNEKDDEFLQRAHHCLDMSAFLDKKLSEQIPFLQNNANTSTFLNEAYKTTKPLYDIAPTWIPIFFSNYQLTPWHGGCAWIFQMEENSPTGAFMQLRQQFQNSPTYLGIYHRDELLAHELSHVGRMLFDEPRYEELIAYRTSRTGFRRYFGSVVQSSKESMMFVLALFLIFLLDIYFLGEGHYASYKYAMWAKLIPIVMIVLALARLWNRHRHFNSCLAKLKEITGSETAANAVIYRLVDNEIDLFAKQSSEEIRRYATEQAAHSLRWRLISKAYF